MKVCSSIDESDNNISNSNNQIDDYKTILDFQFDSNNSRIKINILLFAKNSLIEIFNKMQIDTLELIINFINNYGDNLTNQNDHIIKVLDYHHSKKRLDLCLHLTLSNFPYCEMDFLIMHYKIIQSLKNFVRKEIYTTFEQFF